MSPPATPDKRPRLKDALHIGGAMRLVWDAAPGWTVLNVVMAVVQGVLPLLSVYLMKLIVDAVTEGITTADHAAAFRKAALYIALAAAVGIVAAIPGELVRVRFSGKMYRWQRERTMAERQSWYLHWLLTDGTRSKEVRLFGLGELFRGMFHDLRQLLRKERVGIATHRAWADFASGAAAVLAIFGTFAYIVWKTISGAISLGSMVMYYQAFQTSLTSLQAVLSGLAGLYEDNLFLTYYHEFMTLESRLPEPVEPQPMPQQLREGIVFHDVTFSYADTARTALADIDLDIRPGEVCALVGANGSGKTTLVKLLCRLYDPQQGHITLDGVDLRDLATAELRRGVSVIFQDYSQYQFSARQNIWVGNIDLPEDSAAVVEAARASGADEVIGGLLHGYD